MSDMTRALRGHACMRECYHSLKLLHANTEVTVSFSSLLQDLFQVSHVLQVLGFEFVLMTGFDGLGGPCKVVMLLG